MLSIGATGVPHAGHREPGRTTLNSRGTRKMTTLTKLPHTQPHRAANTRTSHVGTVEARSIGFAKVTGWEGLTGRGPWRLLR